MAIKDSKQQIFNKIGALRTLNDGYPQLKQLTNSFKSINNKDEVINFLIDIIVSLLGTEALLNISTEFLTSELEKLEPKIRNSVKCVLNEKINLGVNPSIDSSLITGVDINISSIDFYNMMKIDPKSDVGQLTYLEPNGGLNSNDFNTFLFESLQDNNTHSWGTQIGLPTIIKTSFNNTINVQIPQSYASAKKMTDFNNNYIDGIKLYDADKVINHIFDKIFGTLTSSFGKTKDEIIAEVKLNEVIKKLGDSNEEIVIDDSFFTFTNDEMFNIEDTASNISNGVRKLIDCGSYEAKISISDLSGATSPIKNSTSFVDKKNKINKALSDLANTATSDTTPESKPGARASIFKLIIQELVGSLMSSIITPKLILIITLNSKYGNTSGGAIIKDSGLKFIKEHKTIFRDIIYTIRDLIIEFIIALIIKEIIKLVAKQKLGNEIESGKNKLLITLSLIGVSSEVLSIIRGLR